TAKSIGMEGQTVLLDFLDRIGDDPVMDTGHIAVYMAIFKRWMVQGYTNPVRIHRKHIMSDAKISSTATYSKKIRELQENGYIEYLPSHCTLKGTWVNFLNTIEV